MASCKQCFLTIEWKNENDRWTPYRDGEIHKCFKGGKKPITKAEKRLRYAENDRLRKGIVCVGVDYVDTGIAYDYPPWLDGPK